MVYSRWSMFNLLLIDPLRENMGNGGTNRNKPSNLGVSLNLCYTSIVIRMVIIRPKNNMYMYIYTYMYVLYLYIYVISILYVYYMYITQMLYIYITCVLHVYMYICIYVYMCVYVCLCICVYVYMCSMYTYTSIYKWQHYM